MKIIDHQLLESVTELAIESPRLRMNYNFHDSLDAKSQRLLNAMEPGTVLPIHRHHLTSETYLVLRGSVRVLFYNDARELDHSLVLDPNLEVYGVNIPALQWHTLEVLESGTVIFEVKDGPYSPIDAEDVMTL